MNKPLIVLGVIAGVLLLDARVVSKSAGILPDPSLSLTRNEASSCGGNAANTGCHRISPFLTTVTVTVGRRALNLNGTTAINVKAINSGVAGNRGGFCADVTAGVLVPGTNTFISSNGNAITHFNTFTTGRFWDFNFRGTKTGLAELFVVGNTVNGNGRADGGDQWAFHSAKLLASKATPVRLFVNAAGVKSTGSGCADGYGNFSVFGAATSPTIGNANFKLEAHGLPTSARFMLMLSLGGGVTPIDMAFMGAPGCFLRTALQLDVGGLTTPGDALRGEGKVILPLPIPNDTSLRGLVLSLQIGALDGNSKRNFPMVVTNGIELTIL